MKRLLAYPLIAILMVLAIIQVQAKPQWNKVLSDKPLQAETKLLRASETSIRVQIQVPGFYTTTVSTSQGDAQVISLPKAPIILNEGEPELPYVVIPAVIGDNAKMNIKVVASHFEDFENMEVAPSKGNISRQIDPMTVPYTYGPCYSNDAFFPENLTDLQEPYILRDYRGQNMVIYPFAYNPVTKTLRVYYDLTVELYQEGIGGVNQMTRKSATFTLDPEFDALYSSKFINYHEAGAKYTPVSEEGDLLVICYDSYMDSIQQFVDWKNTIGRPTTLVSTSTAGSTASALQTYIKNYYNSHPSLAHVLLVADCDHIPGVYVSPSSDYAGYSDQKYGQVVGTDNYNDIFIGRFSANNASQVGLQARKVIHYERDLNTSATWLKNGMGVSTSEGSGGHNGEDDYQHVNNLRTDLLGYNYTTVYQEYYNVSGYSSSTQQISTRINSGVGIITYCNHGSEIAWQSHSPYYSNSYVNSLTNDNMLPFIISVACLNGKYDYGSGDCFAEAWMHATNNNTHKPTGAIGGIFSYISQPWIPPMEGEDEMIDILVESKANNIKRTLGGVLTNGNMAVLDYSSNAASIGTYQNWNIFGDPSMTLRTNTPASMTVTHDGIIAPNATTYTVHVNNGNGALATITKDHVILGSATVNNGVANISITEPGTDASQLTLCVFGYNKVTYLGSIELVFGEKYTINVTANPSNAGTVTGAGEYYETTTATVSAAPNVAYIFRNWKENNQVVSSDATYSFTVTGNRNLVAQFESIPQNSITYLDCDHGTVSGPTQKYPTEVVVLTATPDAGYGFTSWNVYQTGHPENAVTLTNNQFVMPYYDVTVSAVFAPMYDITLALNSNGSINVDKDSALSGDIVTLSATPNSNYRHSRWTVYKTDDITTMVPVTDNQFTMPAYPVTVAASFNLTNTNELTIGSGASTSNYVPTYVYYNYGLTQQIYTAAEVGGTGYIKSISFYFNGTATSRTLDIYLSNTSLNTFGGATASYWQTVTNKVYSGTVSLISKGWTTITFDTPYRYDGSSNLLITVCDNTGSYTSSNQSFKTDATSNYTTLYYYDDNNPLNPTETITLSPRGRLQAHCQIKLGFEVNAGGAISVSPGNLEGFNYEQGQGPSASQSFGLIATDLNSSLTISAPSSFEVSKTQSGSYGSTTTIAPTDGEIITMVYVRLKAGLTEGSYENETLSLEGNGASQTISLNGFVENSEPVPVTQDYTLVTGWSWWSSYIELEGTNALQALEEGLGNHANLIKSQDAFLTYDDELGWMGSLETLENEKMYKLDIDGSCSISLNDYKAKPEEHPITLNPGWNWIGYVEDQPLPLNNALAGLTVSENDLIKSYDGFSTYYQGFGWWGTLSVMEPGKGYMYRSGNSEAVTFTYPAIARPSVVMPDKEEHYWSAVTGRYADNLNVVAFVEGGHEGDEIGAFVDGECRGSALLHYFEPTGQYLALLTLYGNDNDYMTLSLREGNDIQGLNESITFSHDLVIGNLDEPMILTRKHGQDLLLYPNPVELGQEFTIEISSDEMQHATYEIIDVLGNVVQKEGIASDKIRVSSKLSQGIYTVRVIPESGDILTGKVVIR